MVIGTYHGVGGSDIVMNNLCKGLKKYGYETAIGSFTFKKDPPKEIKKIRLKKFRNFLDNYENFDFDIVHSHQTSMNYYSLITPKPFIFHWHGASKKIQELNIKLMKIICKKKISDIISVSKADSEHLKKLIGNVNSHIIYNGVETNFFDINLKQPFKKGDPQLLFVGNLYRHKNLSYSIDIINNLKEKFPKIHLQIVGNGEDFRELEKKINFLNIKGHVELIGRISKEELKLRYASCDIYLSPSKWEMFDMPVIEAMSCGKPALLSDIPAHNELINNSNAGLIFSLEKNGMFENKINEILKNYDEMSHNAREFAKKYDWDIICEKLDKIYQKFDSS